MAQLDGSDIVYVARVSVPKIIALRVEIGTRFPAAQTSQGKVLLAALPAGRAREPRWPQPSRSGLPPYIGRSPRPAAATSSPRCGPAGWALADEELAPGVRSVAVPVRDGTGAVRAAMNVTVHAAETTTERLLDEHLPLLLRTAGEVSAEWALWQSRPHVELAPPGSAPPPPDARPRRTWMPAPLPPAAHDARRQPAPAGLADRPGPARATSSRRASGPRELWRVAAGVPRRRPRTTPPWPPSGRRRRPGWTSSPTARSAGSPTPTTSPPRSTASTSSTPGSGAQPVGHRHPGAAGDRRASGGRRRCRSTTSGSSGRTPTAPIKITVPGPFTMAQQAQNDHYADDRALALAYADVVREEIADLFAAGADIVQLDEPWLQARPDVGPRSTAPRR